VTTGAESIRHASTFAGLRDTHPAMPEESTTRDLVEPTRQSPEVGALGDIDAGMTYFARDAVWEVPALGASFAGVTAIRGLPRGLAPGLQGV
jgi:hypothetical protein